MYITTLNLDNEKEYTHAHDYAMKTPLVIVEGYYDDTGRYSVKVPESFTFVEFKSHWDQDQYIHNNKAENVARKIGLERGDYSVMHDYPRYSEGHCQDALRFYFKTKRNAKDFIIAMRFELMMERREREEAERDLIDFELNAEIDQELANERSA
jgi:hypothetical protein